MSAHPVAAALRRAWSADLSPVLLYALLGLRIEVFVVEQRCPYPELDGYDLKPATRHFWIESATDSAVPVAYLRLLEGAEGFRIGRICTVASARGHGLSRRLMEAALAEIGSEPCVLDAQVEVAGMYRAFGFQSVGEIFSEDGIPHVTMRRSGGR